MGAGQHEATDEQATVSASPLVTIVGIGVGMKVPICLLAILANMQTVFAGGPRAISTRAARDQCLGSVRVLGGLAVLIKKVPGSTPAGAAT
jgi:hypothetical protein